MPGSRPGLVRQDTDRIGEAIEVIRPLADAGDEVAELWLARWLADGDHLGELRHRGRQRELLRFA